MNGHKLGQNPETESHSDHDPFLTLTVSSLVLEFNLVCELDPSLHSDSSFSEAHHDSGHDPDN